jgi:selenocysteine lyase/cysteine desulfurase
VFIPSLPTLPPAVLARPARPLYPLDRLAHPSAQLFYLARAGVFRAVRAFLGDGEGTVLMPAYHHGVEVQAVRAAGARIVFYRVDEKMRADLDDVSEKLLLPDVRALYLTHFVGFAQPAAEARHLCDQLGVKLIEDCALALFSAAPDGVPLGARGDAAIFCLYKTLPLPHGGLLIAPSVPWQRAPAPPLASTLHHVAGQFLAHLELRDFLAGATLRRLARSAAHATVDRVVDTVRTGTQSIDPRDLQLGASRLLSPLLHRTDGEQVRLRRRRNFQRLAEALDGLVEPIGHPLPPGCCPLFLPVRVQDKPRRVQALHAAGVEAIDFWNSHDPACDVAQFPEVARLRREVLELPCHQSLDDDDIDRVARAVKRIWAHA